MANLSSLRHRRSGGGTPEPTVWGVDSEYGVLRDVLLGPPQHFKWLPTSSISRRPCAEIQFEFDRESSIDGSG
jgi:hypothetical protein